MAVKTLSNNFKFEQGRGNIDFANNNFRAILMTDTFDFDRTVHGTYGDLGEGDELSTGNGYTEGGKQLTVESAWARDDVNHKATIAWANEVWTATGGELGPVGGALVLQWDGTTEANSIVVGEIKFAEAITVADGASLRLDNLGYDTKQAA